MDSNDAHAQSWSNTFAEAGYDVPFETVRPLIGMGADKLLPKRSESGTTAKKGRSLASVVGDFTRNICRHYDLSTAPERWCSASAPRVSSHSRANIGERRGMKGLLKAAEVADLMEEKATAAMPRGPSPIPTLSRRDRRKRSRCLDLIMNR